MTTLAFIHNKGKFINAVRFSVAQELAVAGKIHVAEPCKLSDLNISMTKNISDIFYLSKLLMGPSWLFVFL